MRVPWVPQARQLLERSEKGKKKERGSLFLNPSRASGTQGTGTLVTAHRAHFLLVHGFKEMLLFSPVVSRNDQNSITYCLYWPIWFVIKFLAFQRVCEFEPEVNIYVDYVMKQAKIFSQEVLNQKSIFKQLTTDFRGLLVKKKPRGMLEEHEKGEENLEP